MSKKVALVTGSAGGIGAAICARLLEEGYAVAGIDIAARRLKPQEGPQSAGPLAAYPCDIANEIEVRETVGAIEEELGPLSVLVNNAGIGGPFHRIDEVSVEEWEWLVGVNVRGPFLTCREILPRMAERGFGRVVNIASVQGLRGSARSSTYVTTKHALIGLTRALALEWGDRGITVNAICPGYIATGMGLGDRVAPAVKRAALERIPCGRQGEPGEVAALVAFLAREEGAYVNGAALPLDGGFSAA